MQVDPMLLVIIVSRQCHPRRTSIININHPIWSSCCLLQPLSIIPLPHQDGGSKGGGGWWSAVGDCWQQRQRWQRLKAGGRAIIAKQRLGGLRPTITGDKKLYHNNKYDSNAEHEVCKWGANVGFCTLLAPLGRAQVTKWTKCASRAQATCALKSTPDHIVFVGTLLMPNHTYYTLVTSYTWGVPGLGG